MSQITQDDLPSVCDRSAPRSPLRLLGCVIAYVLVGTLLFVVAILDTAYSRELTEFLVPIFILSCIATVAIGPCLVLLASIRCLPAMLLLFASHGMLGLIAYETTRQKFPYLTEILFRGEYFYFALVTGVLSAMCAVGIRRRHWRIAPESSVPKLQRRQIAPLVGLDFGLLLAGVLLIWLMQQGSGHWMLTVPISMPVILIMQGFVWFAMRDAHRGFSPGMVLGAGVLFLYVFGAVAYFLGRNMEISLFLFAATPISLWVGLLLSLRGDGYRWKLDFSAFAEKAPIAEPDPLA